MSGWSDDGVTTFGRVAAGIAAVGIVVLFALGWQPPGWLTAGIAGILFYCMILIAIIQFGELLWQRIRKK